MRFTHILLIVSAILISSCASSQGPLAGRINSEPIYRDRFMVEYRNLYENFSLKNNRSPSLDERKEIVNQTWLNIKKDVILKEHFRKYKIQPRIDEAIDTLKHNPPAYILKSPVFQTNGVFDPALYQQSLLYGQPEDLSPLIRQYRDYYVPIAKLKDALIDDQLLDSGQKKLNAKALSSVVDIDLVTIDASQLDVAVRDEDIRLYYETHKQDFALTPHYELAYGFLPLQASAEDKAAINALADSLFQELKTGAGPETLQSRGHLISWQEMGFFKMQELDETLATAFEQLENGDYLEPVVLAGGIAIHQLNQKTKSMLSYSTLFIPYLPSEKTILDDKNRALQSARLLKSIHHEAAGDELDIVFELKSGISLGEKWLDKNFETPELKSGLNLKKGFVPEPVFYAKGGGWLLLQITDAHMEQFKPLSELKELIRGELIAETRSQFALSDAKAWLKSDAASKRDISGLKSARISELKRQRLQDNPSPDLDNAILYELLIRHLKGQTPKAYQQDELILIPLIKNVTRDASIKAEPQLMRKLFVNSLPSDWFDIWMDAQIKKARTAIYIEQ